MFRNPFFRKLLHGFKIANMLLFRLNTYLYDTKYTIENQNIHPIFQLFCKIHLASLRKEQLKVISKNFHFY